MHLYIYIFIHIYIYIRLVYALSAIPQGQTPRELGVRFMCVSSVVLSARLAFITNRWLSWEDVVAPHMSHGPPVVRWTLRALHTKV